MLRTRTCSLLLAAGLAGCVRIPDSYAPPIQRQTPEEITASLTRHVYMNAPNAWNHVINDVLQPLEGNSFRWAMKHPTLRFRLPRTNALKLDVGLAFSEHTLRDTGPVTIQFYVEDHLLGEGTYGKEGDAVFLKPVPAEWLTTDRPVIVRMELDKLWKSPSDGAERGFILTRIGFVD
jgi:hypothetical protein